METLRPLPLQNNALFVSSSFLDTLVCPQQSEYYKIYGRVAKGGGNGLTFGSHLHDALSLYYRLQEFDLPKDEVMGRVSQLLEQKFSEEPQEEGDWRTLNWAMEIFQQHARKFEFEEFELVRYAEPQLCKYCCGEGKKQEETHPDNPTIAHAFCIWCNGTGQHTIMSEVPFVVKLCDYIFQNQPLPIYFHGFIDLLVSKNNLVFVLDFKSTSKLGQSYWDDKRAIAQPKGYAWAVEQLLGIKTHGYVIRALRTLEPPQYVTNGTASKKGEFKKISDWWDESLCEQRFDFGDGELEEWRTNTIQQVEQFLWHYSKGFFPRNKTMCVGKYGRCQYFEVCHTFPASDRMTLLNSDLFKQKETNINLLK